jgi:hypothetical protein
MLGRRKVAWLFVVACAAGLALPAAATRAQDQCASPAKQRECSFECCGRPACAPSCLGDCVRLCIEGCRSPQAQSQYKAQLSVLKARCGYRSGPARMVPQTR